MGENLIILWMQKLVTGINVIILWTKFLSAELIIKDDLLTYAIVGKLTFEKKTQ